MQLLPLPNSSSSPGPFLFDHSHNMLLLLRHHGHRSWLAVLADIPLPGKQWRRTVSKSVCWGEYSRLASQNVPENIACNIDNKPADLWAYGQEAQTTAVWTMNHWRHGKLGQSIHHTSCKWVWEAYWDHVIQGQSHLWDFPLDMWQHRSDLTWLQPKSPSHLHMDTEESFVLLFLHWLIFRKERREWIHTFYDEPLSLSSAPWSGGRGTWVGVGAERYVWSAGGAWTSPSASDCSWRPASLWGSATRHQGGEDGYITDLQQQGKHMTQMASAGLLFSPFLKHQITN